MNAGRQKAPRARIGLVYFWHSLSQVRASGSMAAPTKGVSQMQVSAPSAHSPEEGCAAATHERGHATPAPTPALDRRLDWVGRARVAWTGGSVLRAGHVVIGGAPWAVTLLPHGVRSFAARVFEARRAGVGAVTLEERYAALYLLDRGFVDPLPAPHGTAAMPTDIDVIVPVHGDAEPLERCLAALARTGLPVTVVDDASARRDAARIRRAARQHGARLVVREANGGPGAARTTGLAFTGRPFVAFVDADVVVAPDWVSRLRGLFDDPCLGAVGPRVMPDIEGAGKTAVEQYEKTHSSVDLGETPSRVTFGVPVGWLPTASIIVRREALADPAFDPDLRVGEDVDLIWRMTDAGWTVRYAPDVVNRHRVRTTLREFSGRRASYGAGAADLDARHPGRLVPAWLSVTGIALLAIGASRRRSLHRLAPALVAIEFVRQRRALGPGIPVAVIAEMTVRSLANDAHWVGHLLRRDWWPAGWAVLLLAPVSRAARVLGCAMLWQPVREHVVASPLARPGRRLALRLLDDASYGSGVIAGALRSRHFTVVGPRLRGARWWL